MKFLVILDRVLRILLALVLLLAIPLILIAALFATDAGTDQAMKMSQSILIYGLLGIVVMLFILIAPQKIERWVPGPRWLAVVVVRILCYGVPPAALALIQLS